MKGQSTPTHRRRKFLFSKLRLQLLVHQVNAPCHSYTEVTTLSSSGQCPALLIPEEEMTFAANVPRKERLSGNVTPGLKNMHTKAHRRKRWANLQLEALTGGQSRSQETHNRNQTPGYVLFILVKDYQAWESALPNRAMATWSEEDVTGNRLSPLVSQHA